MKIFMQGFKEGQRLFGETISVIINSVLLSLVYIFGIGITSILGKLLGKKFLDFGKEKNTYWTDLNLEKRDAGDYFRQF